MNNRTFHSRIVVPRNDRIRRIGSQGFGWLDARLHKQGWLELLSPQALGIYTFLCLAADRNGVSFYRNHRLSDTLGLSPDCLRQSLMRLYLLDLVAHQPFHGNTTDGFHQVLELPTTVPEALDVLSAEDSIS